MGTLFCWWGQRSHIKVKGHLRSSCKIGWKCENGLIWKVEVRLEPNLVYWYNVGTFTCSCGQRSYTKVKGHLRSSCKIGWKCENGFIWKVEVQFEPNLLILIQYGNLHMFMQSKGHKSRSKSACKITCKCKFGLICILEDLLELPSQVWGSRSDVNLHHPQTATAGNTSGPRTAKYFFFFLRKNILALSVHFVWKQIPFGYMVPSYTRSSP